jgi:protein-L-isoaspartate(D-aspartate) O-methyltransferase
MHEEELSASPMGSDAYVALRERMVEEQIEARGVRDARVLEAMRRVPRHRFVPDDRGADAYQDRPLPIGYRQTISQPYVVAAMTELARLEPGAKVLEVGTGSGYQAAIIHEIAGGVWSLEIVGELADEARTTLRALGYEQAHVRHANGYLGWPEQAPFDAIIVTAAPPEVPSALLEQLKDGGRLVIPVGVGAQTLEVYTRRGDDFEMQRSFGVRFVPMVERARSGTGVPETGLAD